MTDDLDLDLTQVQIRYSFIDPWIEPTDPSSFLIEASAEISLVGEADSVRVGSMDLWYFNLDAATNAGVDWFAIFDEHGDTEAYVGDLLSSDLNGFRDDIDETMIDDLLIVEAIDLDTRIIGDRGDVIAEQCVARAALTFAHDRGRVALSPEWIRSRADSVDGPAYGTAVDRWRALGFEPVPRGTVMIANLELKATGQKIIAAAQSTAHDA